MNTDEQVSDYVKLMLGAPVKELPADLDEQIADGLIIGRRYQVNNLNDFVYNWVVGFETGE